MLSSPGDFELSTEKGKRWAQTSESWHRSSRDQRGSLSPFAAWLENALAALVLWQERTPADGEVAQVHLGAPRLEVAVACPSEISKWQGKVSFACGFRRRRNALLSRPVRTHGGNYREPPGRAASTPELAWGWTSIVLLMETWCCIVSGSVWRERLFERCRHHLLQGWQCRFLLNLP